MELDKLKKEYDKLEKRYKLPSFKELNEDFEIEKIDRESDTLLRSVRKVMMDKIIKYLQFVEMLVNPAQAPATFSVFVKQITESDRKNLEKLYESFITLELESLRLEIDYSENEEAKSIKEILSSWNKTKKHMHSVLDMMERNWKRSSVKNERGYLG